MLRVELAKTLRRPRTWLLAAALAAMPVAIVIGVKVAPPDPQHSGGTPFLFPILRNGFFAGLTGLSVVQPFFLPLAVGLLAGDAIAGEAQGGTLRYLVIRPVGRTRLVLSKYASAMIVVTALVATTVVFGVAAGGALFGLGPIPTLSGTELSAAQTVLHVAAAAAFVIASLSGVASIGIWISTLTDSGPGATVATAIVAVASQIFDRSPALAGVHRFLPTHGWLGFVGLFRFPVDLDGIRSGLVSSAAYTVLFLSLAVIEFRRRDITA